MARKKVSRTLSSLPSRRSLEKAAHKAEGLIAILRDVAVKNQHEQPRVFYSLREVAAQFGIPISTVAGVYQRLEQEGLLNRVRGSKTVLQGLHFDRHLSVRAFVGLPASLSAFVTFQDYRMFFIRIRRELRLRGFATAMAFFEREDAKTAALSQRLKAYEVDTVVWFQPPKEAKETALRLGDQGIRVLGVAYDQFPSIPCRYAIRKEGAIRALLGDWKARNAVHRVTLVQSRDQGSPAVDQILQALMEEMEIKWTITNFKEQKPEAFLRQLKKSKTDGIIFSSSALASMFCFRSPSMMTELLISTRVAFINGPVNMPFARVPDVRVDLVTVDWPLVAERIVNDLITQDAFRLQGPTLFEAEAQLRVQLSDFAQQI